MVRELEAADAGGDRAGEGPPLVPEQLALEQPGRNRRTVDLDERPLTALAQIVQRTRDQFLAGAGLAEDEHRRVGRRHRLDLMEDALQRRRVADDLLEVVLGPDLVLEVHLLRRKPVSQVGDLLIRERILDQERDLLRHRGEELRLVGTERRRATKPADVQRSEAPIVNRERQRADRLDTFGEQETRDLPRQRLEAGAVELPRLPRSERGAGGRPVDGDRHVLADEPLARELERPHVEGVGGGVVDGDARVVVRDDAAHAGRDRAEERRAIEVRHQRVVDLEQQLQPVTLDRELTLRLLRGLVVERVVHRERDLIGDLLQELDVAVVERVRLRAREHERAELPQRRRERYDAHRPGSHFAVEIHGGRKAGFRVDVADDERAARRPHHSRRAVRDGELDRRRARRIGARDREEPHDIPRGIVEDDRYAIGARDGAEPLGEIAHDTRDVAVRRRRPQNLEQRPMEVRSVAPRSGAPPLRRRRDGVAHRWLFVPHEKPNGTAIPPPWR